MGAVAGGWAILGNGQVAKLANPVARLMARVIDIVAMGVCTVIPVAAGFVVALFSYPPGFLDLDNAPAEYSVGFFYVFVLVIYEMVPAL